MKQKCVFSADFFNFCIEKRLEAKKTSRDDRVVATAGRMSKYVLSQLKRQPL